MDAHSPGKSSCEVNLSTRSWIEWCLERTVCNYFLITVSLMVHLLVLIMPLFCLISTLCTSLEGVLILSINTLGFFTQKPTVLSNLIGTRVFMAPQCIVLCKSSKKLSWISNLGARLHLGTSIVNLNGMARSYLKLKINWLKILITLN